jgi:hypothetical protein
MSHVRQKYTWPLVCRFVTQALHKHHVPLTISDTVAGKGDLEHPRRSNAYGNSKNCR